MPQDTRALTRAARARAQAKGENYTQAREAVQEIHEYMAETGETYAEAEAWYDDPANELLCEVCGWTRGMVCPECPGCGCYNGLCTGWRHREYADPEDAEPWECAECGATHDYHCVCL